MRCITKGSTGRGEMSLVTFKDEEDRVGGAGESTGKEEVWGLHRENFIFRII